MGYSERLLLFNIGADDTPEGEVVFVLDLKLLLDTVLPEVGDVDLVVFRVIAGVFVTGHIDVISCDSETNALAESRFGDFLCACLCPDVRADVLG